MSIRIRYLFHVFAVGTFFLLFGCAERGDSGREDSQANLETTDTRATMDSTTHELSVLGDSSDHNADPDAGDPDLGVRLGPRLSGMGDNGSSSDKKSGEARLKMRAPNSAGER
jgi:hypothetical protein